jgi:hypothetical protein
LAEAAEAELVGEPHGEEALRAAVNAAKLELEQPSDPWLPIGSAPRDGKMIWLLVDYTDGEHPLADSTIAATIGFNERDGTGEDRWQFAGWCWTHDHFTEGRGKVIAWKGIGFELEPPACFRPLETAEALQ